MIPIYLRIRPNPVTEAHRWLITTSGTTVRRGDDEHSFRRVFDHASQDQVYAETVQPLVGRFLNGDDTCFFTLGATGSGKTYSAFGTQAEPGMIPRALQEIISAGQGGVTIGMFELYNDRIYDLFDTKVSRKPVAIRSSGDRVAIDTTRLPALTLDAALRIIQKGSDARAVNATNCNVQSSRSHAFILIESNGACFTVADLAGSERLNDAGSVGAQRIEAGEINKSLMMFGRALQQLQQGGSPLRQSKLARLLLSGRTAPVMLVTVDAFQNQNSGTQILRYATTARHIKNRPLVPATPRSADRQVRERLYRDMDARLARLGNEVFA